MTLFSKSILTPTSRNDGLRISVMSRHTLDDGITPNHAITDALFDEWLQGLAPPPKLVGAYYKRNLPWKAFEEAYLEFLRENEQAVMVKELATRAVSRNITIMCIEESPDFCHRRLLAEECQRTVPQLEIVVH